jgi:branched-subunit amino acid aminotransferase/4-amino-4-deoxychorismate lyase
VAESSYYVSSHAHTAAVAFEDALPETEDGRSISLDEHLDRLYESAAVMECKSLIRVGSREAVCELIDEMALRVITLSPLLLPRILGLHPAKCPLDRNSRVAVGSVSGAGLEHS